MQDLFPPSRQTSHFYTIFAIIILFKQTKDYKKYINLLDNTFQFGKYLFVY